MKLRVSILKVYAIIFLIGCIGFTVSNYGQLSEGEGWGVVGMIGPFGLGLLLLIVEVALHNILKNRTAVNVIGLIIAIAFTIMVYRDMFS